MALKDPETESPLSSMSSPKLFELLKQVDPEGAAKLHPSDRRKVQARIELYLRTGKPASQLYQEQKAKGVDSRWETLIFWVWSDREALSGRLDKRVDKMVEMGVEKECQELYEVAQQTDLPITSGIFQAIGSAFASKLTQGTENFSLL